MMKLLQRSSLILSFLCFFLTLVSGYFLFVTYVRFGLEYSLGSYLPYARELLWISFLFVVVVFSPSFFRAFFFAWKKEIYMFFLCVTVFFIVSMFQGVGLQNLVIGAKYTLSPLFVFFSSIFLGWIVGCGEKQMDSFFRRVGVLYICILFIGLGVQLLKVGFGESFFIRDVLGYGSVGDFHIGDAPPVWYRTGPGGTMRLQGLFSGPNNFGYFLVGASGYFYWYSEKLKSVWVKAVVGVTYFVSVGWTASRSAYLALIAIIGGRKTSLRSMKISYLFAGGGCVLLLFVVLYFWKEGSSIAHVLAWKEGILAFFESPLGYGLGSSGPSVHYQNSAFLPENYYLQLLLDGGLFGFVAWGLFVFSLVQRGRKIYNSRADNGLKKLFALCTRGVVGLGVIGLFLHVLEDSMVNYLLLVPFGLLFGRLDNSTYSQ